MPLYRVSRKAQTDIRDIGLYTQQQWGKEQRRRFLAGMEERFRHLAETPFLGAERPGFRPPVRMHSYEKHLIVYIPEKGGILIVRAPHENMDMPAHLSRA